MKNIQVYILSGEGTEGSFEPYTSAETDHAIKTRLTKERNGGRWAKTYVYSHDSEDGPVYASFEEPSDLRHIPKEKESES